VAEVLDAHLAQTASLISVQHDGDEREDEDEVDTEHAPVLHRYGRRVMFQVWRNGTTLGLHSQHAPDTPLSTVRDGFSDATIGGTRWRVFSTWDARSRALVQVAEQNYERDGSRWPAFLFDQPVDALEELIEACHQCAFPTAHQQHRAASKWRAGGRVTVRMQVPASLPSSARTSAVASIERRGRRHRAPGSGCRSCSGSSTCIGAQSGSTRRRRP
jgi:hypothetical protein